MNQHQNFTPSVENLQRYLRQLSYSEKNIPAPPVDGIFEIQTTNSLREYQRSRGLPITGNADLETWELLYADYRASISDQSPPRRISIFPLDPATFELKIGTQGFAVTSLQHMLRELSHSYYEFSEIVPNGIYDEATASAVELFQKINLLPHNGRVGRLTWNAISDQYNLLFTQVSDE